MVSLPCRFKIVRKRNNAGIILAFINIKFFFGRPRCSRLQRTSILYIIAKVVDWTYFHMRLWSGGERKSKIIAQKSIRTSNGTYLKGSCWFRLLYMEVKVVS